MTFPSNALASITHPTAKCTQCGHEEGCGVPTAAFKAYKRGGSVQSHFPVGEFTAQNREVIMDNVPRPFPHFLCGPCWDEL